MSTKYDNVILVDHGAGKSYLGFILYDLFVKVEKKSAVIYGVETRNELVDKSRLLAHKLQFENMKFEHISVADSIISDQLPDKVNIVTALHACNTATDDAIDFALQKNADYIVLVPCCQAEVAAALRKSKKGIDPIIGEIWRHPIHAREFGSHVTNVLRCLRLEAHGYTVTATELIGWEHSMKNELIIAKRRNVPNVKSQQHLNELINKLGLEELNERFRIINS